MANQLPTSDLELFKKQISNPNVPMTGVTASNEMMKLNKNLVIAYPSDVAGAGHYRTIFNMNYLNSAFGRTDRFKLLLSSHFITQENLLLSAQTMFFQKAMDPNHLGIIKGFSDNRKKYGYKMIYDIDDFIWSGDDLGEGIPEYNFASKNISKEAQQCALECMDMMDNVCVTTKFLGDYIKKRGVNTPYTILNNAVPYYLWGGVHKKPLTEKLKKPKVMYTGSPCHYHNEKKLRGDWDTAWTEWIIDNVNHDNIEFCIMGGLPFFFEEIKDKIKFIPWMNSYQYHMPIKEYAPDFMIAPLVPNYFNYGKSNLRMLESFAVKSLFIGNTFNEDPNKPSPYDDWDVTLNYKASYEEIDNLFWKYNEPDLYNATIARQDAYMVEGGYWQESPKYVNLLTSILL